MVGKQNRSAEVEPPTPELSRNTYYDSEPDGPLLERPIKFYFPLLPNSSPCKSFISVSWPVAHSIHKLYCPGQWRPTSVCCIVPVCIYYYANQWPNLFKPVCKSLLLSPRRCRLSLKVSVLDVWTNPRRSIIAADNYSALISPGCMPGSNK